MRTIELLPTASMPVQPVLRSEKDRIYTISQNPHGHKTVITLPYVVTHISDIRTAEP